MSVPTGCSRRSTRGRAPAISRRSGTRWKDEHEGDRPGIRPARARRPADPGEQRLHERHREGVRHRREAEAAARVVHRLRRVGHDDRHPVRDDRLPVLQGCRRLGLELPRGLGLRHHELRLLGRHRARRHADLRDPVPLPAEVADEHQPLRRGDDDLRRHVRRRSSPESTSAASGSPGFSSRYPNQNMVWPNFRSPLLWDVFAVGTYAFGLADVLVHGDDPRPGHAARPREDGARARDSTASSPSAGAGRAGSGIATRRPTCSSRRWRPRSC